MMKNYNFMLNFKIYLRVFGGNLEVYQVIDG